MPRQLPLSWGPATRVRVARGVQACETALLAELEELLDAGLAALAEPILLVVPSTSLRRHLLERLSRLHRRPAVLGLDCRTHLGLAASLVERESKSRPGADGWNADLFPLFARRLARREPSLAAALDHLHDGYGAVLGAVRDLLDAGFDPALTEGLEEALASDGSGASKGEVERARALVRVAAGTLEAIESWGLGRSSELLRRATTALRQHPPATRQAIVYGFNDATGLTTDFLLALLSTYGGTLYLDHPPDPVERTRPDPGLSFSRNYRERIEASIPAVATLEKTSPPPRVATFRALGTEAEIREVGLRIRRLLAEGVEPERIGVVLRRLDDYVAPLRVQLGRLAIPFSCDQAVGPFAPRAARLHGLLRLLHDGPRLPVERWLEVGSPVTDRIGRDDLLLALHTLGAGRLEEVAGLDVSRYERSGGMPLGTRRGFEEAVDDPGVQRSVRRFVGAETLSAAVEAARRVCRDLEAWPRRATASRHLQFLDELLEEALGWREDNPTDREIQDELHRVLAAVPDELELERDEMELLLGSELADWGRTEMGGVGGGVQVLDVTAARSLSFDHLFLLGLNRGVFPRVVRDDPLLSDPMRKILSGEGFGVLPDLPVKRRGFHEERYLFAQLLTASPRVTLSWPEVDDQQKNLRAVSPLVERLRLAERAEGTEDEPPTAGPVLSSTEGTAEAIRPPYEAAVLAGLAGDRPVYRQILAIALADADVEDPATVAAARLAILDEADPLLARTPESLDRLGPWLGTVGPIPESGDPRPRRELFVTALEGLAACPWRHFVGRVLGLEPLPDPLEAVPGVEPQLVGSVVHDALEEIVRRHLGDQPASWPEALAASGRSVAWPPPKELGKLLRDAARGVVERRNLALPGLDHALALAATPHLETARRLDWPDDSSRWPVIASEIKGWLEMPEPGGGQRRIRFRADRLDRTDRGLSLTDYKTGKRAPAGSPSTSAGQRLLAGVRSGEWLQAAVYALAADGGSNRGRYLYLNPLYDFDAGREFAVSSDRTGVDEIFLGSASALLRLWDRGILFPRLLDAKEREPGLCRICDFSDACVRGDSGFRRRLGSLVRDWRRRPPADADAAALLAVWDLGEEPKRPGRTG